jgi:hypothetical protein
MAIISFFPMADPRVLNNQFIIASLNYIYGRDKVFFLFITAGSVNIIFEPLQIPVRIKNVIGQHFA